MRLGVLILGVMVAVAGCDSAPAAPWSTCDLRGVTIGGGSFSDGGGLDGAAPVCEFGKNLQVKEGADCMKYCQAAIQRETPGASVDVECTIDPACRFERLPGWGYNKTVICGWTCN